MPAHNFRTTLAACQPPAFANDNSQITAASFTSLAERRAYVQRAQRNPEPMLALPTLERLGRVAPDVVSLWRYWRDLQCAPGADIYNEPEIIVDDGEEPANTGFSSGEQDLEVRPTVAELERAMEGAGRVSVICTVCNGQRSDVRQVRQPLELGSNARIGDLVFRNGRLVQYGRTARGVALKPIERLGEPKGSRLAPPGRDLRRLVRTDAPIVRGAKFLAGTCHSTGRSGAPLECFADREQSRKAEHADLRQALGTHAEILDLAIGDSTAREIGELRGYQSDPLVSVEESLIRQIFDIYGHRSGVELSRLTHQPGSPWAQTYLDGVQNVVISNDIIEDHYRALSEEARRPSK